MKYKSKISEFEGRFYLVAAWFGKGGFFSFCLFPQYVAALLNAWEE